MFIWSGRDPVFEDRKAAGELLASRLEAFRDTDALVLGVPRGGVAVAAEVARQLGLELDVVVARKLGAPGEPELALGAVAADGERFLNRDVIANLGATERYLESVTAIELAEARRRERLFRGDRPEPRITGRPVIVVDDGLATGATVAAACQSVRRRRPNRLIVAVPVAAVPACAEVSKIADGVVCPNRLPDLWAIGYHYRRFQPVEDSEVVALLAGARPSAVPSGAGGETVRS